MSDQNNLREVTVTRDEQGRFTATNAAGVQIVMGTGDGEFSPLELLLAAIAGCTSVDVDALASRRSEPDEFVVRASAHKVKDEAGRNVLADIKLEFTVTFPEGEAGDKARAILPVALKASHDRTCTVGRTVETGVPIAASFIGGPALGGVEGRLREERPAHASRS